MNGFKLNIPKILCHDQNIPVEGPKTVSANVIYTEILARTRNYRKPTGTMYRTKI
jgi:hypothetical protein